MRPRQRINTWPNYMPKKDITKPAASTADISGSGSGGGSGSGSGSGVASTSHFMAITILWVAGLTTLSRNAAAHQFL